MDLRRGGVGRLKAAPSSGKGPLAALTEETMRGQCCSSPLPTSQESSFPDTVQAADMAPGSLKNVRDLDRAAQRLHTLA